MSCEDFQSQLKLGKKSVTHFIWWPTRISVYIESVMLFEKKKSYEQKLQKNW